MPTIVYSMSKSAFIFMWLIFVLWLFFNNIGYFYLVDTHIHTLLNNVLIISANIFIFLFVFFSYIRYFIFDDRIEMNCLFHIKTSHVLSFGKRLSSVFALPFGMAPSTIFYRDIAKIWVERSFTAQQAPVGGHRYSLYVQLNNMKTYRLLFFDIDMLLKGLESLSKCQSLQGKIQPVE